MLFFYSLKLSKKIFKTRLSINFTRIVWLFFLNSTYPEFVECGKTWNNYKEYIINSFIVYNGKEAVTHVHVLERFKHNTLVQCKLETGRTHQIRVHMQYIRHPIVGDPVYGYRKQEIKANGQILHAYQLTFVHPRTKQEMTFTCPIDEEFERALEAAKNKK